MVSKETEQFAAKMAEVKAEMEALKAAIKKKEKELPQIEAEADTHEVTELFAGDKGSDRKTIVQKDKTAEQHPHLDVSPGDHTLVGYEVLHPHANKSVKA